MEIICKESFNGEYLYLTSFISNNGERVSPRGLETKEVRPAIVAFEKPLKRLVTLPFRNINPFFLVIESLWILSGRNEVHPLRLFNNNISQFSDDGIFFHASYGRRLRHFGLDHSSRIVSYNTTFAKGSDGLDEILEVHKEKIEIDIDQLKQVIEVLKTDSFSRKAVASIWNPIQDLNVKTKDTPCNDLLMFKIRNNKLNLSICNRSNDLHWGLPTNLFQFSTILEIMAYVLNIEVGEQVHFTDSLHIYNDNDITEKLLSTNYRFDNEGRYKDFDVYNFVEPSRFFINEKYKEIPNLDLYDKVFSSIENTFSYFEMIETEFEKFLILSVGKDMDQVFNEKIDSVFLVDSVKSQSEYLYDLMQYCLSYFIYKKAIEKRNEDFIFPFLLRKAIEKLLNVKHIDDLLILGSNFYYTLLQKRFEDPTTNTKIKIEISKALDNIKRGILSKFNYMEEDKRREILNFVTNLR